MGLPVLRALSLCTCCRQYPGAAAGRSPRSSHLAVSAFPDTAVGSACTSTFSRLARRSLALRPAHSRGHQLWPLPEGFRHFVASMPAPVASGWSDFAGWASHPLESAAFSRRTPITVVRGGTFELRASTPTPVRGRRRYRAAAIGSRRSRTPSAHADCPAHISSSSRAFASFRSAVSNPSVNQP